MRFSKNWKRLAIAFFVIVIIAFGINFYRSRFVVPSNEDMSTSQKITVVYIHYNSLKPEMKITAINDKKTGFVPDYKDQPDDGYKLVVLDKDNVPLYTLGIGLPFASTDFSAPPTAYDLQYVIPTFDNAAKIQIQDVKGNTVDAIKRN